MANATIAAALQLQNGRATGGQWGRLYTLWKVLNAELVNATASVETVVSLSPLVLGFALETFLHFGLWIKATSVAGTPDIAVKILQAFDDTAADYVVPEANGILSGSIADENAHIFLVQPTPMPWLRYQVVGNPANPADTLVTAYAFHQMGE